MVNNNPIGRAVLTAWCFWYVALFLLAAGYFGVAPWRASLGATSGAWTKASADGSMGSPPLRRTALAYSSAT